jgi:cation diffusion facilitator CzcD-associated flavoprotein CzcO
MIGDPMSFWETMPIGMLLRSNETATGIPAPRGALSLDGYRARTGRPVPLPVPVQDFIDYGRWVQQRVAPDVDRRRVEVLRRTDKGYLLTFSDGSRLATRRVVVAAGIADFVHLPDVAQGAPHEMVSHSSQHRDLGVFRDLRVLVVGLGQSALESAALMHEAGAVVEVVGRRDHITWLHGGKYHRRLGRLTPLFYAPTDVGPLGLSRVVAANDVFRRLPRSVQEPLAYRAIRPAGAAWLAPRLEGVTVTTGRRVTSVKAGRRLTVDLDDGSSRVVDHALFGTGYRVDVTRYPFLDPSLVAGLETARGYPVLHPGMESSVPGLHFLGATAAWSFGPTMRFVAGGWYGGESVARAVAGTRFAGLRPVRLVGSR